MNSIWTIVEFLLTIAWWIVVAQAILSWLIAFNVINTHNDFVRGLWQGLDRITAPIYNPIRRIMPDFGALDLSPMVVLLVIMLLMRLVHEQVGYYPS